MVKMNFIPVIVNGMSLFDAAVTYVRCGWHIVPIGGNKKPLIQWKKYQNECPTPADVNDWFKMPVEKLGWVLWANGFWAMDADGPEAVKWMMENSPPSPIWTITKRGRHLFYRAPPGVIVKNQTNVIPGLPEGNQIDIRGKGGMVIIQPSRYND
jgi:hypothetical protein